MWGRTNLIWSEGFVFFPFLFFLSFDFSVCLATRKTGIPVPLDRSSNVSTGLANIPG
ncbi:hypothetical protein BDV32DRAFT_116219 [Aspergillus pseudonomiae]|nr:hypothetical protein BDV32DRAFT_116219 [Aspergillus pseudonomiae]